MRGADGEHYAVKTLGISHDGLPTGRTMFNEYVAGSLGKLIGAPVPEVALICVPRQLVDQHNLLPRLSGLAHGSHFIRDCREPEGQKDQILFETVNRERFALLAVFLGWAIWKVPGDKEFIYDETSHRVYCIDFGNFLGGPDWKVSEFQSSSMATLDDVLCDKCKFTSDELADARALLVKVTPEQLVAAIGVPPNEWGVEYTERVELAKFLWKRREELLSA